MAVVQTDALIEVGEDAKAAQTPQAFILGAEKGV